MLKLLTGMNNDVCPLNFRSETEKDNVTPDPYYAVAPGWATLSGGRKPFIHMSPIEIVGMVKRAGACVPMVGRIPVFVVDAQGDKREVTVDELASMDIKVQVVPNLYKRAAPSAAAAAGSSSNADVSALMQRQGALEAQVTSMKALMEQVAATTAAAMAAVRAVPPPAAVPAPSASAQTAIEKEVNDENDEAPIGPSERRSKRARAE